MNMKKTLLIVGLVVLALGALGVGVAFAQGPRPPVGGSGYGWMHDYVEQALAAKLDLTEEQVEEALAAGIPMYRIALDNGIAQENLASFMNEVHQDAFAKAVAEGVITQERADWMLQRMQNMYQNGYGFGNCPMHNGQGFGPGMTLAPGASAGVQQNRSNGYGPGMMRNWGTQKP
jgi:hypothetical protein